MLSVLGFLAILAPLVVVHEFGHFFFAKVFGVKAEIFSVGFGPKIWSRFFGETEFRVSAIPLGGYVKLLGEESGTELTPELRKRALPYQAPWKRFFIFFGGPLFNFLFAIVVFMAILMIGEPQIASVIARVVPGSTAQKAGFESGDRVLRIGDKAMRRFQDIISEVSEHPEGLLRFEIQRAHMPQSLTLTVTPSSEDGYSIYGEEKKIGYIDGLLPLARGLRIGVSDPNSIAARAGVKTGDDLLEVNGQGIKKWEEFERMLSTLPVNAKAEVRLKIGRPSSEAREITLTKAPGQSDSGSWGLYSSELFVDKTIADSPAQKAGIQPGDRIAKVGGRPVYSFYSLKDAIQEQGEKTGKVEVSWEREGKMISQILEPSRTHERDPALKKMTQFTIGVVPSLALVEPETVIERELNPLLLGYKATARMLDFTWRNIVSIGKMVRGDVSVATLGGPILIGKIAGDSLERGLIAFLTTMAILSVGLGILNVLPIPVLDGGHLLLLGIEAVRGRPLTIRQTEIVQQVGLSLILLLMVIVIRNDLARLPIFN